MKFSNLKNFECQENEYYTKEELIFMANNLKKLKAIFGEFVKSQNSLSDKDFMSLYKKIFVMNEKELYKAYFKQKFRKPVLKTINVEGTANVIKEEGRGRDYSWWTEYYKCSYKVICNENTKFEDKEYTQEEINKLIEDGKLIVINNNIPRGERLTNHTDVQSAQNINNFMLSDENKVKIIRQEMTAENIYNEYSKWLQNAGKMWETIRNKIIKESAEIINIVNTPKDLFIEK